VDLGAVKNTRFFHKNLHYRQESGGHSELLKYKYAQEISKLNEINDENFYVHISAIRLK
jgi:hypothetical protein